MYKLNSALFTFLVFFAAACESIEKEQTSTEIQTATLPSGAENTNCGTAIDAPAMCDWLTSLDGLYLGNITKISMPDLPAVDTANPDIEVQGCPSGIVNQGMAITVKIVDSIVGSASAGTEITVVLGVHQLDELDPRPALHPTNGIVWAGGEGLKIGDRIGVPVHMASDGRLGLLGEPLLSQDVDGRIITQQRSICQEPVVEGLAGATTEELRVIYEGCGTSQEAEFRRAFFADAWQERKTWAYAGMCFGSATTPTGCITDSDCPTPTPICIPSTGTCTAESE